MRLLSSFEPRIQAVLPPYNAAQSAGYNFSLYWHPTGQAEAAPAGTWLIRNAIVDKANRRGPWSAPAVLENLPAGWLLFGSNYNLPYCKHRAAVVWQAEQVGTGLTFWLVEMHRNGKGSWEATLNPVDTKQAYPWSTNNPHPYLLSIHDRANASIPIAGTPLPIPSPPPPLVWACRHQLGAVSVCRAWVTHSGQTALSPIGELPAINASASGFRRVVFADINYRSEPIPPGALGYYLYTLRNGYWQRRRALPWMSIDDPNGCLFQVHDNQPIIWDDDPGEVYPTSSSGLPMIPPVAFSVIGRRQVAMLDCNEPIIVDIHDVDEFTPCIDVFRDVAFNRTTASAGSTTWNAMQRASVPQNLQDQLGVVLMNNHPTYWPLNVIQNQGTSIVGMLCEPDTTRGPGMSCAITSADFAGGQAMKFSARDCSFTAGFGVFPFITRGLYVGWESAGTYAIINDQYHFGHTASEWTLANCSYGGTLRIELCGPQTVNMLFLQTNLIGYADGEAPTIHLDGASAKFYGLVGMNAGTVFSIGSDSSVKAVDVFFDKPGVSLLDLNGNSIGRVEVSAADTAGFDFIVRSPVNTGMQRLRLREWDKYRPALGTQDSVAYCAAYHRLSIDVEDSPGLKPYIELAEPEYQDFVSRTAMYNLAADLFQAAWPYNELGACIAMAEANGVDSNVTGALELMRQALTKLQPPSLIQGA